MRKNLFLSSFAIAVLAMTSCSKMGPLTADNFNVTPNPLEAQGGQVSATINGVFPEKYMKKKAVVTVTPELRFAGEAVKGQPATFQGEKVRGNDQTISYKVGGNYTMKSNFQYDPRMRKSELYLTFDAHIGKKEIEIPAVKVADGVIATSELYSRTIANGGASMAEDAYQRVNEKKQEARIQFLINQAKIRKDQIKGSSVTDFVNMLKEINRDTEGLNVKDVEVLAYASPEGGFDYNDKLAKKRQDESEKFVQKQLKETDVKSDVNSKYTAQDWEGFQELVAASDIQDKDLIIRVLSMYKDPEQREEQIRNMSATFKELADGILPELRRSRLIINYETIGRSDAQILEQFEKDPSQLSVEELLYGATLVNDADKKETIYKKATELYPNDARAYSNVAAIEFNKGNDQEAQKYLDKALRAGDCAEANVNLALIDLRKGDNSQVAARNAEKHIAKAADAKDVNQALGNKYIAEGKYAQAADELKNSNNNSAALAQILCKDYAKAMSTLNNVDNKDGMTYYLMAIVNARQGNKDAAAQALQTAIKMDQSLAQFAHDDLEFDILRK